MQDAPSLEPAQRIVEGYTWTSQPPIQAAHSAASDNSSSEVCFAEASALTTACLLLLLWKVKYGNFMGL